MSQSHLFDLPFEDISLQHMYDENNLEKGRYFGKVFFPSFQDLMLRFVDGTIRIDLQRFEVGSTTMFEGDETTMWKATGQGMRL